jgi:predicted RNA-binding protein YlxR (DUF448 family)
MAAKSKRPSGDTTTSEQGSGMYLRASRHREDLMEEARALRRAGKIRAAKGVESRVQQLDQLLGALESERQVGQEKPH